AVVLLILKFLTVDLYCLLPEQYGEALHRVYRESAGWEMIQTMVLAIRYAIRQFLKKRLSPFPMEHVLPLLTPNLKNQHRTIELHLCASQQYRYELFF